MDNQTQDEAPAPKHGSASRASTAPLMPCRPSLRERVDQRRRCAAETAAHEQKDAVRLTELSNLLESHPAVARILELIEATGV